MIQEKLAATGVLVSASGLSLSMLDTIHKLMQIGAAFVSIVAGALTVAFWVRKHLRERAEKNCRVD